MSEETKNLMVLPLGVASIVASYFIGNAALEMLSSDSDGSRLIGLYMLFLVTPGTFLAGSQAVVDTLRR